MTEQNTEKIHQFNTKIQQKKQQAEKLDLKRQDKKKQSKQQQQLSDKKIIQTQQKQSLKKQENNQKQKFQSQKQSQKESIIKMEIKKQLIGMQFDINDIQEALLYCNDLDKAIQFIIAKLEENQKIQSKQMKEVCVQVKLFLIARMDLKMGPGKIAAQVGHAVLKSFQMMRNSSLYSQERAKKLVQWLQNGRKTKILKVQTQKQLFELIEKANNKSINCCHIRDAGRTQIAAGSTTVAAIGPIQQNLVDFLYNLKEL